MLKYFLNNNLIYPKQSGFRPSEFCANQLLSVIHVVFTLSDNGLRTKASISGHI